MTIQAIQTRYAGCHFRSRLEARWAVFFNTLGVKWEYEKEGFELPSGKRYLPDFWLPWERFWVEVKGQAPTTEESDRCAEFATAMKQAVFLAPGLPVERHGALFCFDVAGTPSSYESADLFFEDGELGVIVVDGHGVSLFADAGRERLLKVLVLDHRLRSFQLRDNAAGKAAAEAKSARFEFGEADA